MKRHKVLLILLMIVFIIVFSVTSYIILKDMQETNENNKATEKLIESSIIVNEETKEKKIDWEHLQTVNEDIIAWIEIEGTNINYPILKDDKEKLFYLTHTYDKTYNNHGSIFTTNSLPFDSEETIIYGHNMKDKSMFSQLGKYMEQDFLNEHRKINIYTKEQNYIATVFSCYSTEVYEEEKIVNQLSLDERIQYYMKKSKFKENNVNSIEKIIKLSTCSYINNHVTPTNQRYYVIAKLEKFD